jgi:hypothetical protein
MFYFLKYGNKTSLNGLLFMLTITNNSIMIIYPQDNYN